MTSNNSFYFKLSKKLTFDIIKILKIFVECRLIMKDRYLEADIKNIIINHMVNNSILEENDTLINEFTIGDYTRRVDLALIKPNKLYAYEVKSASDNLMRLEGQIKTYLEYFDKVTVVAASKHIDKILDMTPLSVAVWELENEKIKVIRRGRTNSVGDKLKFLDLMTVSDLLKIVRSEELSIKNLKRNILEQNLIYLPIFKLRKYAIQSLQEKYKSTNQDLFNALNIKKTLDISDLELLRVNKVDKNEIMLKDHLGSFLEALEKLEEEYL